MPRRSDTFSVCFSSYDKKDIKLSSSYNIKKIMKLIPERFLKLAKGTPHYICLHSFYRTWYMPTTWPLLAYPISTTTVTINKQKLSSYFIDCNRRETIFSLYYIIPCERRTFKLQRTLCCINLVWVKCN